MPHRGLGQPGGQACHEVDTCFHHRRRMQIRADGSRRDHRTGQPEMQWHDRRFTQCADQDQHRRDPGRPVVRIGPDHHLRQQITPASLAEQHHADQHRQPARRGDQQGLQGRAPAGDLLGVVAHQQERQHGGELPEGEHHDHVVADHKSEHGSCEGHQVSGEDTEPGTVVVVEIFGAIGQHECADAEYQHRHDRGEAVQAQIQIHVDLGRPRDMDLGAAVPVGDHPHQARERCQGEWIEPTPAQYAHSGRCEQGGQGMGEQDSEQTSLRRSAAGCGPLDPTADCVISWTRAGPARPVRDSFQRQRLYVGNRGVVVGGHRGRDRRAPEPQCEQSDRAARGDAQCCPVGSLRV